MLWEPPDFVDKLDRSVSNLETQDLQLASQVKAVLWNWALKPMESDVSAFNEILGLPDAAWRVAVKKNPTHLVSQVLWVKTNQNED